MDPGLKNKTAFVTGPSDSIGAAAAQILPEGGSDVVLTHHRNRSGAGRTARINRNGGRDLRQ